MRRGLFIVGSTLFWIIMMFLLIQREFFQVQIGQARHNILSLNLGTREEYNAIYMGDEQIGFSFTVLEPLKKGPAAYELRFQNYLSFLFLGQQRDMLTRGFASLDKNLHVQEFGIRINSAGTWTTLKGQIAKNNLNLEIESNTSSPTRNILPVEGPIFFPEMMRFLWSPDNLHVGKRGSIKTWNPLSSSFQTIEFKVTQKTKLEHDGRSVDAYVVVNNIGGMEVRSWVSPEGVVLRDEGVTGIVMVKQEGWQIFDRFRKQTAKLPDLPNLFSVPSNQVLEDPNALKTLKIKILNKQTHEEKILEIKDQDLRDLENIPFPPPLSQTDKSLEPYLASDAWIQSQEPRIKSLATEITAGSLSSLEAVIRVKDWIHKNMSPIPSMGVPQATQVLESLKGDCNEYAVLFTALMRAAGVPAKMKAGLVYQNGRFYYHAWADVYLDGRWISIDPTFNQIPADVTHIPLTEGKVEDQINLVTQIGQIKVFILEAK